MTRLESSILTRPLGAGVVASCLLVALVLSTGPSFADKLVVFSNGKAIRAKSIKEDKGWTRLELDGGAVLGVRTRQIAQIEDTSGGAVGKIDVPQNQATVGGAGGGFVPAAYTPSDSAPEAPPPPEDFQQANEDQPVQGGQQPGVSAQVTTGNPLVPGARPWNQQQQPFGTMRGRTRNLNPNQGLPSNLRQGVTTSGVLNRRSSPGSDEQGDD